MSFLIYNPQNFFKTDDYKNLYPAADEHGQYIDLTYDQFKQEILKEQKDNNRYNMDVYRTDIKKHADPYMSNGKLLTFFDKPDKIIFVDESNYNYDILLKDISVVLVHSNKV